MLVSGAQACAATSKRPDKPPEGMLERKQLQLFGPQPDLSGGQGIEWNETSAGVPEAWLFPSPDHPPKRGPRDTDRITRLFDRHGCFLTRSHSRTVPVSCHMFKASRICPRESAPRSTKPRAQKTSSHSAWIAWLHSILSDWGSSALPGKGMTVAIAARTRRQGLISNCFIILASWFCLCREMLLR